MKGRGEIPTLISNLKHFEIRFPRFLKIQLIPLNFVIFVLCIISTVYHFLFSNSSQRSSIFVVAYVAVVVVVDVAWLFLLLF